MLNGLMKRWKVNKTDLILILCVFAITGTSTAYISKLITGWVGFTEATHWIWKLSLRLVVLIFGYQIILLFVALLFGQFPFFWRYEKKILQRIGVMKKGKKSLKFKVQSSKVRIAIFASGAGSNAEKLIQYFRNAPVVVVSLVVCNKPGAGVISIAERECVPVLLIEKEQFFRGDAYLPFLQKHGIDFIVLAGFLWKIPETLIKAYPKRIVNIHPALLPKYGGKGMFGQYVHKAVLHAGDLETGITIHFVDEHYDNGDIIFQTACPVLPGDGPADIAQRVHQLEHLHYPGVVEEVIKNSAF